MLFHAYLLNLYPRRIFLYQLCFLGIFFLVLEHKRELTGDLLFIYCKHKKRCCAHMPPIRVRNQLPATTAIAGRHPLQSCWADGMRCGYTCWHCHAWHTLRRTNSDRGTVWGKNRRRIWSQVVPLKAVEQLTVLLLGPHPARGFVLAALFRGTDNVGHCFHHVHSPGWQLLQKDRI